LTSVEKTLRGLQVIIDQYPDLTWEAELKEQASNLKSAFGDFHQKIVKYDLGGNPEGFQEKFDLRCRIGSKNFARPLTNRN